MFLTLALGILLAQSTSAWYYGRPDPGLATKGGVWPLPWSMTNATKFAHKLNPATFQFTAAQGSDSDVLTKAFTRYMKWTFPENTEAHPVVAADATLPGLTVTIAKNPKPVGYPQLEMDESYTLEVPSEAEKPAQLTASEIWGALRGLETFSQLVYYDIDAEEYSTYATSITDHPRFPHRGTLVDSSRHFLSVNTVKRHLDMMAHNKMNVFHWHLVDSEAFPYTSALYPDLSLKGAYTKRHIYSIAQMKDIIDYARNRGIRVVAEFDTPGHMGAWGPGVPGLLSDCFDYHGHQTILPNIFDPTKEANFEFLGKFFKEALTFFPDNYMHFGGDEVSSYMLQCWYRNPKVRQWMTDNGFGDDTYAVLNYYFQRLFKLVDEARANTKMVVWQEVLDNEVNASHVIAHVWKGNNYEEIMAEMQQVTAAGHHTILSSCWYLNYIKYGNDWGYIDSKNLRQRGLYYECDPTDFDGTEEQKKLVLGGEAAMWAEYVDGTNLLQRMWPRASAVAERLWSNPAQTKSADAAWPRLHEHSCRMMRRGYPAQPINNPDFCPAYWDPPFDDIME